MRLTASSPGQEDKKTSPVACDVQETIAAAVTLTPRRCSLNIGEIILLKHTKELRCQFRWVKRLSQFELLGYRAFSNSRGPSGRSMYIGFKNKDVNPS